MLLQTDRPLALVRGLPAKWKVIGGRIRQKGDNDSAAAALTLTFAAIEKELGRQEQAAGTAAKE